MTYNFTIFQKGVFEYFSKHVRDFKKLAKKDKQNYYHELRMIKIIYFSFCYQ